MAQDNAIPLLGFQGESPVDNFLSSYSKSQQQAQGNELHQRKIGMLDMQSEQDKLAMVADALVNVADGDAAGFERVKQGLVARKIIDPQTAAQYDVSALPQIKAASEKWRAMQKFNMDQESHVADMALRRAQIGEVRSRAAKARAEERAAALPPGMRPPTNEQIDNEAKVRGEYTGQLKDFVNVRDAFGRVAAAAEDPSAAGDLALIFNYMKMLDPGSVVREQEFANAQNAAGVPERIRAAYNNALKGERLTDNTRADFLDRAGRLFSTQLDSANKTREIYGGLADQYGFDRNRVTPDLSLGVTSDIIRPKAAPTFTSGGILSQGQAQSQAPVDLQSAADAIVGIKR